MKTTTAQKLEAESLDMVPHEDLTNYYNPEGATSVASIDEVSQVAYHRFVEQGSIHGHDVDHWIEAEDLVHAMHGKSSQKITV
jgi:hypothetical protein